MRVLPVISYAVHLGAEYGFLLKENPDMLEAFQFVEGEPSFSENMDLVAKLAIMMEEAVKERKITWARWKGKTVVGDYSLGGTTENIIKNVIGTAIAIKRIPSDEQLYKIVLGSFEWSELRS